MKKKYKIEKPIRLIELFGGIGSQAKALENIKANFESHVYCDFDKYATISYNVMFDTQYLPSDITVMTGEDLRIKNKDEYEYILTYSFPCQDVSQGGKGEGMSKGSGTRSGLLWEVERLLNETKELPQILLMENVPQVIGKKFLGDFNKWTKALEELGYTNHYDKLMGTCFGIPQKRKRVFMVSILGDYDFEFPEGFELETTMRDYLEPSVEEKYYLSDRGLEYVISTHQRFISVDGVKQIGNYVTWEDKKGRLNTQDHRAFNKDVVGTIPAMERGIPKIVTKSGFFKDKKLIDHTASERFTKDIKDNTISPTIKTKNHIGIIEQEDVDRYRIRKLTPRECWRLMGFTDQDFDKAKSAGISDTQLYKQAGNSIIVPVLEAIFKQLLGGDE